MKVEFDAGQRTEKNTWTVNNRNLKAVSILVNGRWKKQSVPTFEEFQDRAKGKDLPLLQGEEKFYVGHNLKLLQQVLLKINPMAEMAFNTVPLTNNFSYVKPGLAPPCIVHCIRFTTLLPDSYATVETSIIVAVPRDWECFLFLSV